MRRAMILGALAAVVGTACSVKADEVDRLVSDLNPPKRFANHTPSFTWKGISCSFKTPTGTARESLYVVLDGDRHVAVFKPSMYEFVLLTHDPAQARQSLALPPRYHWATFEGSRMNVCMWYDGMYVSSQTHTFSFKSSGATLEFVASEDWTRKRNARSAYTLVLRCDPVLGYVVDYTWNFTTNNADNKQIVEFSNTLAGHLSDPWPDRWQHDRTIYTPSAGTFRGWYNNLTAADKSDNAGLPITNGGFIGWFRDQSDGWATVLTRGGDGCEFRNATCNVWQDQHNQVALSSGQNTKLVKGKLCFLPPEIGQSVRTRASMADHGSAVVVKLGVVDEFESALPGNSPVRGCLLTNATIAGGGSKGNCLKVMGEALISSPQVSLDADTRYRVSAKMKCDAGEALIKLDYYEYGFFPVDQGRLTTQRTPSVKAGEGWKDIVFEFTTPSWDPFLDLRFSSTTGQALYVDGFSIVRISSSTGTRRGAAGGRYERGPGHLVPRGYLRGTSPQSLVALPQHVIGDRGGLAISGRKLAGRSRGILSGALVLVPAADLHGSVGSTLPHAGADSSH